MYEYRTAVSYLGQCVSPMLTLFLGDGALFMVLVAAHRWVAPPDLLLEHARQYALEREGQGGRGQQAGWDGAASGPSPLVAGWVVPSS